MDSHEHLNDGVSSLLGPPIVVAFLNGDDMIVRAELYLEMLPAFQGQSTSKPSVPELTVDLVK
jgi:hypothetical protein